jgi:hypothetical protein
MAIFVLFPRHPKFALVTVLEVLRIKNINFLSWFERIPIGNVVDIEKPIW